MNGEAAATRVMRAREFIDAIPYAHALGMRFETVASGECTISMPWDARLIGDPATGVIHGGAVSALLDTVAGAAVLSHPQARAYTTATIDLRIDYMRAAVPGQRIRAEAQCYHVTRSVAFVRAQAFDDDHQHPVAAATGAFTLVQIAHDQSLHEPTTEAAAKGDELQPEAGQ
jgi:uncharacterized protein (TIGR00369 family)